MVGVFLVAAVVTAARDPAVARCSIAAAYARRPAGAATGRRARAGGPRCGTAATTRAPEPRPRLTARRTSDGVAWRPGRHAPESRTRMRSKAHPRGPRGAASGSTCIDPARRTSVDADRRAARPPPADRRGHRRAQPAGEGRRGRGDASTSSCSRCAYEGEVTRSSRSTSCSGARFLLTVHEPAGTRGRCSSSAATPARSSSAARTSSCTRSPTASSTATSRSSTRSSDEIDDAPGRRHPAADDLDARAAVRAQARAHRRCAARSRPAREIFNQLTNRDSAADLARAHRLLPRRVRPPDPGDRRAGHRPRARRRARSRSTCRRSTTTCR